MEINQVISSFVHTAIQEGYLAELDRTYMINRLLSILKLDNYQTTEPHEGELLTFLDQLVDFAIAQGVIEETSFEIEALEAAIMDLITPLPSQVNHHFWELYQQDKKQATDFFYRLSQANDYIKTRKIAQNIEFKAESPYGLLDITINLSKPEKDPKMIAYLKTLPPAKYPLCALCLENEGYRGSPKQAARQNHRIIRVKVKDHDYGFQYSPYVYFNEHSIFINQLHQPMSINQRTFENLLELVKVFPHYFVGSNADLPITGGSILAHDHYQAGRFEFAMARASVLESFTLKAFPSVEIDHLHWPMSVMRLRHQDPDQISQAAGYILDHWRDYSDASLDILARSGDEIHNTITPIARFKDGYYELDLVLRNNRTSAQYPDGIFHPHPDVQHIKRENIGLIEVMGLAILPPRLLSELEAVQAYLAGKISLDQVAEIHQDWAQFLQEEYSQDQSVEDYVKEALGVKFARILEDAGVFKLDQAGRAGFQRFIESLNKGVEGCII